jgi:hypothetical protein
MIGGQGGKAVWDIMRIERREDGSNFVKIETCRMSVRVETILDCPYVEPSKPYYFSTEDLLVSCEASIRLPEMNERPL